MALSADLLRTLATRLGRDPLSVYRWLRYGAWLTQLVMIRRCNLSCSYCSDYDKVSTAVPYEKLCESIDRVANFGTLSLELTGGEPLMHPRVVDVLAYAREAGIPRRRIITNGFFLTPRLIERLNDVDLYQLSISIDGIKPRKGTPKVLGYLHKRLDWLATHARFRVQVGVVLGTTSPEEVGLLVEAIRSRGFILNLNLLHDAQGQLALDASQIAAYREHLSAIYGRGEQGRRDFRRALANGQLPDFRCRAGARYLYIDEFSKVCWCSHTRHDRPGKSIESYRWEDLHQAFYEKKPCSTHCTVGCARGVSRLDEWRPQV